jgi:hypothetical protein
MRWAVPVLAAVAAAALIAAPVRAENHGIAVTSGDRCAGELSPAGDTDAYVVPVAAGGRLSVTVEVPADSLLTPTLALRAPNGNLVSVDRFLRGAGGPRLLLRGFPATATGLWSVVVGGEGGVTGAYAVSFQTRTPVRSSLRRQTLPAGGSLDFPFAAGDGALLSFQVRGRRGPAPAGVALLDPDGDEVPLPEGAVRRHRKHLSAAGIPIEGGFGAWVLHVLGDSGADTVVDVNLKVRSPRPAPRDLVLGPEPRPTGLAPNQGREGIEVLIGGRDFPAGARVRFGETWASGVEVLGATSIRAVVPDGPESQYSQNVKVAVVDALGQENAAPSSFRYLGPPRPTSVTPKYLPPEGNLPVVIAGFNFRPGFSVAIGGVDCPDAVLDPLGTISCTAPAHEIGTAAVAVTDEFGRTGILAAGLHYVGPPGAASAAPVSSSFTGGRTITLTGVDLRPGVQVEVDGVAAEGVTWVDNTRVRFSMPAGPAGDFDLTVRDEFGRSTTAPGLVRRRGPFVDASADAVPEAPAGTDFFGTSLAMGDLDGDGSPDLLVSADYALYDYATGNYLPPTRILMNGGDGTFQDGTGERLGPWASAGDRGEASFAALGDLDGASGAEVVLSVRYPLSSYYASFQRNGKTYAYAGTGYYGYYYTDYPSYNATRILGNDGSGHLSDETAARAPASGSTPAFGVGERWQASAGAIGDLDGDGDADLVLTSGSGVAYGTVTATKYVGGIYYLLEAYQYVAATRVLLNDGTGVFTPKAGALPAPTFMNGSYSYQVAEGFDGDAVSLGDLDGDGDSDLVVSRSYPRLVYHLDTGTGKYTTYYVAATRVLRNDGTGKFSWATDALPPAFGIAHAGSYDFWQADSTALGDIDGDGDRDLVLGRGFGYWYDASQSKYVLDPAVRIFANDGSGKFTEATGSFLDPGAFQGGSPDVIVDARSVLLGDLDGDGSLDLVLSGEAYYVYDYAGTGYGYRGLVPSGPILATRVLVNDGAGHLKDQSKKWLPTPVNGDRFQCSATALGDLDGDDDLDLVLVSYSYADDYMTTVGHNRPLRVLKCE